MNQPIKALFMSRKFLLLLLDTVIALSLYFVGRYSPVSFEDVSFFFVTLQPVFASVIVGIAVEDAALKRNK